MSSPGTFRFGQVNSKPSAPPLGYDLIYVKTDDVLYIQDSSGVEVALGSASSITQLTGDVSATGPGIATATVNSVGGVTAANVASGANAANAATASNVPSTIVLRNASGNFSAGTITASLNGNASTATTAVSFSGSLNGDVTGTQSATVVSFVDGYTATQVGASVLATQNATSSNTPGTIVERDGSGNFSATTITASLVGNVTGNVSGSSSSFTGSLSGDVTGTQSATTIASTVVTGKLLTGYVVGSNTPIAATDSILLAFEKVQGQLNTTSGSAITALTGDGTATGPGSVPFTLATVNSNIGTFASVTVNGKGLVTAAANLSGDATTSGSVLTLDTVNGNVGTFGSSTSIPTFTVNAKGLITAASGNAVVAPAGTLTGTTLASNVVSSSLTSVGTITSGTWNGTTIAIANGGTGQITAAAAFAALSPLTNAGDIIYENSVPAPTNLPIGTSGQLLTVVGGLPAWATPATHGTVTSVALLDGSTTPIYAITGSPVTSSGTLTFSLENQSANTVFAGPSTGSAAQPTFRLLVSADIPNNAANTTGTASNITATTNSTLTSLPNLTSASSLIISGSQVTGFTQGSVLFAGASGQITQDNPNFYWNDSTFNLGLGLIPATNIAIDVLNSSGASKAIQTTSYGTGSSIPFRGRFARGTVGTPAAAQAGDNLSVLSGRGYGTSQFAAASTGAINIVAGETFTNTSNQTYLQFQTTPTGSVTAAESMRIATTGVTLGPQSGSTAIHQINGGVNRTVRTVTASTFTVDTTTTDDIILTDSTSNAITITLPTATAGRQLFIQDKTGQAATNHITVTPPGAVTINGVNASILLGVNYGGWLLFSDGTNWVSSRLSQLPSVQAISASNIDWSTVGIAGGVFTKTLSANTTFTFSNATPGQTIVIRLTNTASNFTVTWPSMKWPVQTSPVMTTGAFSDVYTIVYDGTNFFGSYVQNF